MLENEKKILIDEKKILIDEKNNLIDEKNNLIQTIAKNPRKTTTTTINNTLNLSVFNKSDDDIKQLVNDNFNKDYLIQGQK